MFSFETNVLPGGVCHSKVTRLETRDLWDSVRIPTQHTTIGCSAVCVCGLGLYMCGGRTEDLMAVGVGTHFPLNGTAVH